MPPNHLLHTGSLPDDPEVRTNKLTGPRACFGGGSRRRCILPLLQPVPLARLQEPGGPRRPRQTILRPLIVSQN